MLVFTSFLLRRSKEEKSPRENPGEHGNWGRERQYRYTCLRMYRVVSDKLQQHPRRLGHGTQCN